MLLNSAYLSRGCIICMQLDTINLTHHLSGLCMQQCSSVRQQLQLCSSHA